MMGLLPAISSATLFVFAMTWAALHDIARGDSGIEYAVLAAAAAAFGFLYRAAIGQLAPKQQRVWLIGTGTLTLLFCAAAGSAIANPKYAGDPFAGTIFLTGGLPAVILIGYRLAR